MAPPPSLQPSPTKSTPHVPPITRVLNLVTQHEEAYRQQELQMADMARRLASLEEKHSHSQDIITAFKERSVFTELDVMRASLHAVSEQLGLLSKMTQDALQQHDSKALQLGLLSTEVQNLKAELLDVGRMQQSAVESLEQLVARQAQQAQEAASQQVEGRMQGYIASTQAQLADIRVECSAASSSSETVALQVNSLAIKLRSYAQIAEQAQQMLSTQMEELKGEARSRHEAMSSSVDALQASGHKVKKHVVRLAKQVEGLQAMGAAVMAAEATARQVKEQYQQASAIMAAAGRESTAATAAVKSLKRQLQRCDQQEQVADMRQEITLLAESMSDCLQQLSEAARRQASSQPSYLQTLLGGPLLGGHSNLSAFNAGPPSTQPSTDAWDTARSVFERFLHGHRLRSLATAAAGSSGHTIRSGDVVVH